MTEERVNIGIEINGLWHWFNLSASKITPLLPILPPPVRHAFMQRFKVQAMPAAASGDGLTVSGKTFIEGTE